MIYCLIDVLVSLNKIPESQGVGTSVGIGTGIILFILVIIGLVYLRL